MKILFSQKRDVKFSQIYKTDCIQKIKIGITFLKRNSGGLKLMNNFFKFYTQTNCYLSIRREKKKALIIPPGPTDFYLLYTIFQANTGGQLPYQNEGQKQRKFSFIIHLEIQGQQWHTWSREQLAQAGKGHYRKNTFRKIGLEDYWTALIIWKIELGDILWSYLKTVKVLEDLNQMGKKR